MPDPLDDDYVAKLLAEDAKKTSIKYAAAGLSALLPANSTRPGPKPNTRFLSHLVRDVDSHNAALRRKEQLETQTRIEGFRKSEREDERRRALDLAGNTRNRNTDGNSHDSQHHRSKRDRGREGSEDRREGARRHKHTDNDAEHRHKRRRRNSDSDVERKRERRKRDYDRTQAGRNNVRTTERDSTSSHRDKSSIYNTRLSEEPRNSSRSRDHHRSHRSRRLDPSSSSPNSDSDPLEDIVGSLHTQSSSKDKEPVRIRGRGALQPNTSKSKSNIDIHFSSTYNPSLDTQPDQDVDPNLDRSDWDMALEALRDRETYKKKQSDRMREAGFTSEEIGKWERGALNTSTSSALDVDRDTKEVKWKKKGEGREWDLGKKDFSDNDEDNDGANEGKERDQDRRLIHERSDKDRDKDKDRRRHSTNQQEGWKGKNSGFMRSFRSALGSS